jgi:hypothetical protein
VTLPALFETPSGATAELTAVVSADRDSDDSDNSAQASLSLKRRPAVLSWAGFAVEVLRYSPGGTEVLLNGDGLLVLASVPPLRVQVAFSRVAADDSGVVASANPLDVSPSPPVVLTGTNGAALGLTKLSLPARGPLLVDGTAVLPASAGVETVNGGDTLAISGRVLTPDLVLRDSGLTNLALRDLPLALDLPGPVDLDLQGSVLLPVQGTAVGRPSYDLPTSSLESASNDGMLLGSGVGAPPNFRVTGSLSATTGLSARLSLASAPFSYQSLFPRATVGLSSLELTLGPGTSFSGSVTAITGLSGDAAVGFSAGASLPLDPPEPAPGAAPAPKPNLVPTSSLMVAGTLRATEADESGGLAGRVKITSPGRSVPQGGVFGWVARNGKTSPPDYAFFASDERPLMFLPGGHTPGLPHEYLMSRLRQSATGAFSTVPLETGSAAAPMDPGLNLVTHSASVPGTSASADQEAILHLTGSTDFQDLGGPKLNLYLRPSGVSGVWGSATDAESPAATELYGEEGPGAWGAKGRGFPLELNNVSIGFLDSDALNSNLAGNITLRYPLGAGQGPASKFAFEGMTVRRDGQLGKADVPPSGALPQEVAFWGAWLAPRGLEFVTYSDYPVAAPTPERTWLGLSAGLTFAKAKDPPRYLGQPLLLDGLLFGGPGHPHPTRAAVPHLDAENLWMDFRFHPTGVALSDPRDAQDPQDPFTPVPWIAEDSQPALAAVQPRPTAGSPGWLRLSGALKLPYYGNTPLVTYLDPRDDYVTLDQRPRLSRELFAGVDLEGTFAFKRRPTQAPLADEVPGTFIASFDWSLPGDILKANGSIELHDSKLGANRGVGLIGLVANSALVDTAATILGQDLDVNRLYKQLGNVGPDYDKWLQDQKAQDELKGELALARSAAKLEPTMDPSSGQMVDPEPVTGAAYKPGWSTRLERWGMGVAHPIVAKIYDWAKDSTAVTALTKATDTLAELSNGIPLGFRFLNGAVRIKDQEWEELEASAGLNVFRVIQDGSVSFRLNRHNECWIEMKASKATLPFVDIIEGAKNASKDRKAGLGVSDPYLRLYLVLPPSPRFPRLDGSFGCGSFNLLEAITVAGVSIPPPTSKGLQVTHLDASFGIGRNKPGNALAYVGAALGLKGEMIAKWVPVDAVSGSFLAGIGIDDEAINITGVLNPDIKAALKEGMANAGVEELHGLMVGAGLGKTLFSASCFLNVGCGIDGAVWAFLGGPVLPIPAAAIIGARLYGEVHGTAICVLSVKGEIAILGQLAYNPPQDLTDPGAILNSLTDANLLLIGKGKVSGSLNLLLFSISFGAGVTLKAETNPSDLNVDVELFAG